MAIPNYSEPQLNIDQLLDVSSPANVAARITTVIAPRYVLSRYGKEETPVYDFDAAGDVLNYETLINGSATAIPSDNIVDLNSVKLYGINLEAVLASYTLATTPKFYLKSLAEPNIIKLTSGDGGVAGSSLDTLFRGRAVQVGDIVIVNDGVSGERRRVVVGFEGTDVAAKYGTNGASDDNNFANSAYNPATATASSTVVQEPDDLALSVVDIADFNALAEGSKYLGKYGELFTLTVATGGAPGTATVNISSASGLFSASAVPTTDDSGDYSITDADADGALAGLDLLITPTGAAELTVGQIFKVAVYGAYERLSVSQIAGSDTGSGYTGPVDTVYTITVVEGGTGVDGNIVQIASSSGLDTTTTVTLTDDTDFLVGQYGLRAKFDFTSAPDQGGLRTGDVYFVRAFAATQSTTAFDKVILSGPASDTALFTTVGTALTVTFRLPFTGEIAADAGPVGAPAWSADADEFTLNSGLSLYVASRSAGYQWVAYADGVGEVAVSFRALNPLQAGEDRLIPIEDTSDISEFLGTIDLDNDAAEGAFWALTGAGGLIYVLLVDDVDADAFSTALETIEGRDDTYSLVAITEDSLVMGVLRTHVNALSSKTLMRWRRGYVGSDSPGRYFAINKKADNSSYTATVSEDAGENVVVQTADANFTTAGVVAGDIFKLDSDATEYIVDEVLSATELRLVTGPPAPVNPAAAFTITKADTPQSQADFISARSRALGSRRIVHVWQEGGTREISGERVVIPNKYVAAEIAGIRSAVAAQQGLTKRAITSVSATPAMYTRYRSTLLNEVASNGTCIITQDAESSEVYIRHQLTTDPDNGILYYEDSVGVNVDAVAFLIKSLLSGFIGKYNVNRRTITRIDTTLSAALQALTTADVTTEIGPQLIDVAALQLSIPVGQQDTIAIKVQAFFPVPLNKILVTLQASLDPVTGVVTTDVVTLEQTA